MQPSSIIFHHTAVDTGDYQLGPVNVFHKGRGFPLSTYGLNVGYHYLIEYDGSVVKCRSEHEIGAHDKDENEGSIGIALAGDFNLALPTYPQEKAAARLTGEIMRRWGISGKRIYPHRANDTTACPGTLLSDDWLLKNYLKHEKYSFKRLGFWVCLKVLPKSMSGYARNKKV